MEENKSNKFFKFRIIPFLCLIVIFISIVISLMFSGAIDGSIFGIVNMKKVDSVLNNYINNNQVEDAGMYALRIQSKYKTDEKVLLYLLDTVGKYAPTQSYDMINNYCANVPESNRSVEINNIVALASAKPVKPIATPEEDTYISSPVVVSFGFEDGRVGHRIYYTADGSTPSVKSDLYSKPIEIKNDCTIKVIVENCNGDLSEVYSYKYVIDEGGKSYFKNVYEQAKSICDNAVVGDDAGQCLEEPKLALEESLKLAENVLKDSSNTSAKLADVYIRDINARVKDLQNSMSDDSDKTELKKAIENANSIIDKLKNEDIKNYKSYYTRLANKVKNAEKSIKDNRDLDQYDIDSMTDDITLAMDQLTERIDMVGYDSGYESLVGTYSNSANSSRDSGVAVKLSVTKVANGKFWGNIEYKATKSVMDNGKNVTYNFSGKADIEKLKIQKDGTSFTIKGKRSPVSAQAEDYDMDIKLYFNNVDTNTPSVYISFEDDSLSNIGLDLIKNS